MVRGFKELPDRSYMGFREIITNIYLKYCTKRGLFIFLLLFFSVFATLIILFLFSMLLKSQLSYLSDLSTLSGLNFTYTHRYPVEKLVPFDSDFPITTTGKKRIFLDGHSHTMYSDGYMTPEQLIQWGISNGYNAMVVTDHNTIDGGLAAARVAKKYSKDMVVIVGEEFTCCRIHMNLWHINETVLHHCSNNGTSCAFPSDEQLRWVINRTHELGGLVIVNHYQWSQQQEALRDESRLCNHPSIEDLIAWNVDGFEIYHENVFNLPVYQKAKGAGKLCVTGSDIHEPLPAHSWTTFYADDYSADGIIAALRNSAPGKGHSFVSDPVGTPFPTAHQPAPGVAYYFVVPILNFYEYISKTLWTYHEGMWSFYGGQRCHKRVFYFHFHSFFMFLMYLLKAMILASVIFFPLYYLLFTRRDQRKADVLSELRE